MYVSITKQELLHESRIFEIFNIIWYDYKVEVFKNSEQLSSVLKLKRRVLV